MHDDIIMSVSWSANGNLLATSAKDKKVRIIDVRANRIVNSASSHENNRDSRVVWLGDTPYILTTGFDSVCNNIYMRLILMTTLKYFNLILTTFLTYFR